MFQESICTVQIIGKDLKIVSVKKLLFTLCKKKCLPKIIINQICVILKYLYLKPYLIIRR